MASGCYFLVAIPNRKWLCYYSGIYSVFLAVIALKSASLGRDEHLKMVSNGVMDLIACAFIFHIMQNLRLNRFFKERKSQVQSQQMSDIFDSQSDAILAFEKVSQTDIGVNDMLNILFSNIKCSEFFSFDFMQTNK